MADFDYDGEELHIIYGVKNDPLIMKLIDILEEAEVNFEFKDFRDHRPTPEQLMQWADFMEEEFPLNYRSTFVKKNKKIFDKLPSPKQYQWIIDNYQAIERPIILNEEGEIVWAGGRPERIAKVLFNLVQD
ncbi:arsenate reductase family protein [Bacteriovorax sp. Seq25_V]|uniref:arsenate reductase family protein n=1 Tax=Bacteriovorax sp. Seq25_V TaxID=1201288 RepID=UPI00038A53A6|nr:ArsC family transcriptional regulator [Bacteriovorax sp. Seq25_V]EQC47885.1 ArsC family protein [Bacteriovorax sp. Seq25_V]